MRRTYYLIDTENVGDRWLDLPEKAGKKDHIISFYTEHHSNHLEKYLSKQVHNPKILWLECAAGNNALDYQLMGVLSYLIAKHPKASYCIYSNDKDYQETVDFWKSRGVDVRTKGYVLTEKKKKADKKKEDKKNEQKKNEQKKNEQKKNEQKKKTQADPEAARKRSKQEKKGKADGKKLPFPESETQTQGKHQTINTEKFKQGKVTKGQYPQEIARSVPVSDLSSWYCAATALLGLSDGREWYLKFKKNATLQQKLSIHYHKDPHFRGVHLTALAFYINGLDVDGAKDAYLIIQSHSREDLNGIKADFNKKFSFQPQQEYFKAIKPLVKVIKGK